MTSFATFQPIQDANAGIVRIYGAEVTLYKYCLQVVIDGDTATVAGEVDKDITEQDYHAMGRTLAAEGIKKLVWLCDGQECFINVAPLKVRTLYD